MSSRPAVASVIEAAGAICAVGRGVKQVHASVRAGIGRLSVSTVRDRHSEPIHMALCPEATLEPLVLAIEPIPFDSRRRRMVRLAASALREVVLDLPEGSAPLPVFLGLPEPRPGERLVGAAEMIHAFGRQAGVPLHETQSQLFARGRSAALLALEAGVQCMIEGRAQSVLVGGVDSYLDLPLLGDLDLEGRIHGPRVTHGFVPGEGAAFVRLTLAGTGQAAAKRAPRVAVLAIGTAQDPGHRYSDKPSLGEGLSQAIGKMLAKIPRPTAPIESTFADLNGEMFGAKEWGVASVRYADLFSPVSQIHHPADCFGDTGAATGALLIALAYADLARGDRAGPALVLASSDREDRACALLDFLA